MSDIGSDFQSTIEWYDDNAKSYSDKISDSPSFDLIKRFSEHLLKGAKILDAGCAAGRDSRIFKDNGYNPVGVDLSLSLIKLAKQNNPDIAFEHANFVKLPFEEDTFDGIWAHASLLHLETDDELKSSLSEFNRVLKSNGVIHISVKQQSSKHKTDAASHQYSGEFKRFFRFYTKNEIQDFITSQGWNILDLKDEYVSHDGRNIKWVVALAQKPKD